MRIKTGETVTAMLPLVVNYRCSACGKENHNLEIIKTLQIKEVNKWHFAPKKNN